MYICKESAQQITICECVTAIFAIQRRLQITRVTQPFQKKIILKYQSVRVVLSPPIRYSVFTVQLCIGFVIFIIKISPRSLSLYLLSIYSKWFYSDPTWEMWSNKGWWHFSYVRTNCIIIIMRITSNFSLQILSTGRIWYNWSFREVTQLYKRYPSLKSTQEGFL